MDNTFINSLNISVMKKVSLPIMLILFAFVANAQLKKAHNYHSEGSDTIWSKINERLVKKNVSNGDVRIHIEPGKYDIYVSYKKGKVFNYYAVDIKGKKIPVSYMAKDDMTCRFCITRGLDIICYDVDCSKLPPPIEKATIKTAH